mmetsp:Transcript_7969/g.25188  ORF Transcript_7969/g.25188 Transcript_7969/m.25188 type:complete len:204 (-) Transcript_7969:647-1258(-)
MLAPTSASRRCAWRLGPGTSVQEWQCHQPGAEKPSQIWGWVGQRVLNCCTRTWAQLPRRDRRAAGNSSAPCLAARNPSPLRRRAAGRAAVDGRRLSAAVRCVLTQGGGCLSAVLILRLDVLAQHKAVPRRAQLAHRLRLNLPHALARDGHERAHLLEGARAAIVEAVPQPQHVALAQGEDAAEQHLQVVAQARVLHERLGRRV